MEKCETNDMVGGELLSTVNMLRRHIYNNRAEMEDPKNHPTSTQEWFLVYIVQRKGQDVFQKDLETQFNVRGSTATEILKAMERKGLILREPLPQNKRAKKITLTPKGLAICQENHRRIMEIENKLLTGFEQEEIRQLLEFLSRMQQNME
ncbi:MAG TPA: MarR family transcriptional regulator [Candidatus Enterocloster excrementigallinarum]|uniref:MarR family transcriptional regulator n=1 Tax=Candidatus Enterocloster excrementigallinarum TaxID=2838558 RepID=A0A9D2PRK4_9FIRM|nr:MarR family transcriptional regulator [Candidatus Enterocloster excrementigallinarum]